MLVQVRQVCAEVLLRGSTSWDGICRVPEVPTCALSVPAKVAASTPKEAEVFVDFAWKTGWPIMPTLELTVGLGTEQEFELSATYDSPTFAEKPGLEMSWDGMWYMIDGDGVQVPPAILRE
jgi:hypothetical protein